MLPSTEDTVQCPMEPMESEGQLGTNHKWQMYLTLKSNKHLHNSHIMVALKHIKKGYGKSNTFRLGLLLFWLLEGTPLICLVDSVHI